MKRTFKNQLTKIAIMVLCIAMLLSACGGTPAGTAPASTGAAGSTATAAPAGSLDGVLDVGYSMVPDTLTVFRANTNRDAPYWKFTAESLAIFDGDKVLQPWCAKSWSTEDGGFTYDIEIFDTIKDSEGNAITAADVVWFIQESMAAALKPVFAKVDGVEQTGDYTLQVTLNTNQVGTFETVLTDTYIISQAAYEASADGFGTSCVTTSPYAVTEFTAASVLALEKRSDYWQDEANLPEAVKPNVEKITFHQIAEASQMGIALETGEIDMAFKVPSSTGAQFVDNPNFTVELTPGNQGYQVFFSGADQSPVANDVALRQAICYAIDADGLVTGLCAGFATPMWDSHSPIMIGYNTKWENEDYYGFDLDKAKQLVEESDYSGQALSILCTSNGDMGRLAQMLQSYCMQAGINVEINSVDMAQYTAIRLDGTQYDLVLNSIGGVYLADAWSIRYDMNAYSTGDATSRHDATLADLLYETWTPDGYTEENIDKVHYYLKDNAISYGMVNPQNMTIWRNEIGLETPVYEIAGYLQPAASTYSAF